MSRRDRGYRLPDGDIGTYLAFFGPITWMLYGLYVVYITYAALVLGGPSGRSPLGVAALVLVLGALLLIALPSPTPLPMWRTLTILGVIVFATAAVTWQLPVGVADLGYRNWQYNPCDLLMFCLALRARIGAAWIGQALMQGLVALWSLQTTGSVAAGLLSSYTQMFPLIACTVFAIGLHQTARRIVAHRAAEQQRAETNAREDAADRALEAELGVVRRMTIPVLGRIAAGDPQDPAEVRALEASLRDRIRNPGLVVEPLASALRAARENGKDVLVLDDLPEGTLNAVRRRDAVTWAAQQLSTASGARLTLRLALNGGQPVATLTSDGAPVSSRVL